MLATLWITATRIIHQPFLVLCIITATLAGSIGLSDFSTRGEAREAIVAQRIFLTNNWIETRGYGDTVASKPPLLHWSGAVFSKFTSRVTEFSTRLPSVIAAFLGAGIFLIVLRRECPPPVQSAFIVVLFFSFEWLRASVSCRVDMVHSAAVAAAIICGYRFLQGGLLVWAPLCSFSVALAILGKGPVGGIIPAIVLTAWLWTGRELRTSGLLKVALLVSCGVLLGGFWYFAAFTAGSQEFALRVWHENFSRFLSAEDAPHRHSVFYLSGVFVVGLLPWSAIAFVRQVAGFRFSPSLFLRGPGSSVVSRIKRFRDFPSIDRLCIVAIAAVFFFYSIPASKRSVYLLSAYPFCAVLLVRFAGKRLVPQLITATFSVGLSALVLYQYIVNPLILAPSSSERKLAEAIVQSVPSSAHIFSFGFEFYGASFYSKRTIFRLEDILEPNDLRPVKTVPAAGDVLLVFDRELQDLRKYSGSIFEFGDKIGEAVVGRDVAVLLPVSRIRGGFDTAFVRKETYGSGFRSD